jgi:beta-lactam-binding protein with PASTA domain
MSIVTVKISFRGVFMKKFICLLTVLCLIFACLAGCGNNEPASSEPEQPSYVVDNFVGMTEEEIATNKTFASSYVIEFVYDYSSDHPKGEVFAQLPAAGESFHEKPHMTISVSLGTKEEVIPKLIGKDGNEAREILEKLGFNVIVEKSFHKTVENNKVFAVNPKEGTKIGINQDITLHVSDGAASLDLIALPVLSGKVLFEAERIIADLGLSIGTVTEIYSDAIPAGQVVFTTPDSGEVYIGSSVDITVSLGAEPEE